MAVRIVLRATLAAVIALLVAGPALGAKPLNWCASHPTHARCSVSSSPWTPSFRDDFTEPKPLGAFPATNTLDGPWGSYPGWRDTAGYSVWDSARTVSVADGVLSTWLHDGYGAAIMPNTPDVGYGVRYQLYGRYEVRLRATQTADYGVAYLLWPRSETWPRDGEIDFPEGHLDGTIHGFVHHQGATSGADQYAVNTGVTFADWHTTVVEWLPGSVTFYLDGQLIGRTTERVPNSPMRLVLQSESFAPPTTEARVEIDYVKAWRYTP